MKYCRPQNVDDALRLLGDAGPAGRVLVGGTDLLVGVRRRPLEPLVLVDLKAAGDLPPAIQVTSEMVRLGPTATMTDIAADERLAAWFPALVGASRVVGSVAIRNRASLIGNICNASPAADTAPALLVHSARVTIVGPAGERTMPLSS
ncbi:MAG: xanthine dehydrogenase family protein subunit M, partial [Acidimicrobiales bacterium]